MSDNVLYWTFLGLAFALPFIIGVSIMRRTNRLALSFWLSTVLNAGMTVAALIWWKSVNMDSFRIIFGNVFFGISSVNLMVLELFALLSIRKKTTIEEKSSYE
ncbi:cytochrome c oxidase VIIc family protein [Paenibacillus hexagrammi]|uniref:Cytochrome c oxidase VIIc family protein n=1 Tax=Paenibacillus hexagrammi TaxID=2908839 RepID=A0ABY3SCK1_9BACL|nr:cytochrome c oxidase VIIc family protein [Paenibacillus sp. YPD9-1]UJF31673.1 cytochrome c oxidase VIIc family protein [Paenibacillus sp. YPD9-1]